MGRLGPTEIILIVFVMVIILKIVNRITKNPKH
jgi:Sec-independent protein translocase protein TatA